MSFVTYGRVNVFDTEVSVHDVRHTAGLRRVSHQCKCQRSSGDSNIHCNCAVSHALKTRISTRSSTANAASGCGHPELDPCYWTELATEEKTLLALLPTSRMVPTTMTRITASMTAYSAMSCPRSSFHKLRRVLFMI